MRIVLASASPRRREILTTLGVAFDVEPSGADEEARPREAPGELARRLAADKAREVSARREGLTLGADTIVVRDGRVLGKPADDAAARAMIAALAGGWHEVVTAVALARHGEVLEVIAVATRVRVAPLTEAQIDAYVRSGEGQDKAGGYAVQGLFAGAIERIEGSYTNVVGLPAAETIALLVRHGAIGAWP